MRLSKINYPYTFRILLDDNEDLTMDNIKTKVKSELDDKSDEINKVINESKWEPYSKLKTWDYPDANFDLYDYLNWKEENSFKSWTGQKTLSYYDTFLFAVYWNNLKSSSAKYDFVFRNYLNDEVAVSNSSVTDNEDSLQWLLTTVEEIKKVPLPWAKRFYEIAYLKSPWTAEWMFINVDPEEKETSPIAEVASANAELDNYMSAKVRNNETLTAWWENTCSPPDGVSIFEWFPSVLCRLWDLMDTDSFIWPWNCWGQELRTDEDETNLWWRLADWECERDVNKNQIKDCIEKVDEVFVYWEDTSLFNKTVPYNVSNNYWWVINVNDDLSVFTFEIEKIEAPKDETQTISSTNKKWFIQKVMMKI